MKQRVITAIVALAIFIPIILAGGLWIQLAGIVLAIIAMHEFYKMKYKTTPHYIEEGLAIVAALLLILPLDEWIPSLPTPLIAYYGVVILLMAMTVFNKNEFTIDELGFPIFTSLYVGMGFDCFVNARHTGVIVLFFALLIVWSTDIGAYMIGRQFGRHKLAPNVSPNKTIEGAIGGVISALVVAGGFMLYFKDEFMYSTLTLLILIVIFSIAGQLGDLVESAYKRHFDVKDSGNLLPGHGGILDRFDSLLFVFPMMYLFGLFV